MSVYKRRGSDTYSFDFELHGTRYSGNTGEPSKRKAEQHVTDLKRTLKAAKVSSSKPMTFGAGWSLYWQQVGQFHRNSGDTARALEWLETNIGKGKMLAAISDADVAKLVAKRRGENVSPSTVNRSVTEPLRAILKRARDIWGQSVQRIEWKTHLLDEPQERVREASLEEEGTLTDKMRNDYAPALQFAMLTGCRRMEIVGLTWRGVDFINRTITVTGKRDKTRTFPMTEALRGLLLPLLDHKSASVFTYVCRRPREGQIKGQRYPITKEGFKTEWRRTKGRAEKVGVVDFKFHDSRHTAATRLLRATGNLRLAQRLLGHTDLATTAKYAHATDADLRAGMEAATPTQNPTLPIEKDDKALK